MGTDLQLALLAADLADAVTLEAFRRSSLAVELKADDTPVSEADRGAEVVIRQLLAQERPGDAVLGEEMGGKEMASAGGTSRRWVLDPIDGTANFVRGVPVWATLIGLEVDGVMKVGVVSAPALGRRWWAEQGSGAFAGPPGEPGEPIKVSDTSQLSDATISFGCVGDFSDGMKLLGLIAKGKTRPGLRRFLVSYARRRGSLRGRAGPRRRYLGRRRSPASSWRKPAGSSRIFLAPTVSTGAAPFRAMAWYMRKYLGFFPAPGTTAGERDRPV